MNADAVFIEHFELLNVQHQRRIFIPYYVFMNRQKNEFLETFGKFWILWII